MTKRQLHSEKPPPTKLQRVDHEHPFRLLRSMSNTFDFVFRVGEERFQAHRNVLASASPYFMNLLYNGMKESRQEEVCLPKFSPRTWRSALDFIYGEEVNLSALPTANMLELMDCADFYQMKKMERGVLKGIESSMDVTNFRERFIIAEQCENKHMQRMVEDFVDKEFIRLCELNAFVGFDLKAMENFLSSEF